MSIYPLLLAGWEDASTWGEDNGHLYAQLTRNGVSDDNEPQFWITSPHHVTIYGLSELTRDIARATGCGQQAVLRGLAIGAEIAGIGSAERRYLGLPN